MTTTRSSFPIDFDFYNENEEQVLFITENVSGQEMTLEIGNPSDKPTTIKTLSGAASATNHHFELVFRPGVIHSSPSAIKIEGSDFELFCNKDSSKNIIPNADGTISLYFKAKTELTLNKGEKLTIKISQIRGDIKGSTRGTRVLLKYQNLWHAGNSDPFSGYREIHMNIINHKGRKNIPLHMGFVGHNTVLNDGNHSNELRLRISNSSRDKKTLDAAPNSRLVLSMEGGAPSKEWTLATNGQLKDVHVEVKYPGDTVALEEHKYTGVLVWDMPFKKLEGNKFIDVLIKGLVTNHPTGHANLYLHYENIPGYWDAEFVTVIEKSPLTYNHKNVGIGTPNPGAKLEVDGTTKLKETSFNGNIHLEPSNLVNVNYGPWATVNRKFIEFKTKYNNDINRGMVNFYAPSNYYTNKPLISLAGNYGVGGQVGIDNPKPDNKLDIGSYANNSDTYMAIKTTGGNVHKAGIKLRHYNDNYGFDLISDETKNSFFIKQHFKNAAGVTALSVDGNANVGIGTATPSGKLTVVPAKNGRGLEIFSPSSGNTHLPYTNNWNYISGNGVIFRSPTNVEKVRIDSNTGNLKCRSLQIGGTVIGVRELNILKKLAAGNLQVDLWNTKQQEYMYAADYAPFDGDRRRVFTWRRRTRINQGQWKLRFPV